MIITLVWRTDVHLSDTPPQSRTDDWTETILGKLRQVGDMAKNVGADAVIDGGDFFHVKSPTRNTHRMVNQVAKVHQTYPCPVYANIGNHDCKYGDYDYLHEQPLGVLFETGVFNRLYDEHEAVFHSDMHIPETPSDPVNTKYRRDRFTVRVVGVPYHGTEYDMARLTGIKKGDEDFLVVAAHLLASPKGGSMFEGEDIVKYADLAGLDPDVWLFGHWHKDQGITEIAPDKWVVNIGSLSRGALSQDEVSRVPSVAVLTFVGPPRRGVRIDKVPLEVRPPDEVFDLEGRVRSEARDFSIEVFVDSIQETLAETHQDEIPDIIRAMDSPTKVKESAILYWEQA